MTITEGVPAAKEASTPTPPSAEPATAARRSPRTGTLIRLARHATQVTVTGFVAWQIARQFAGDSEGAEGFCPFGGFETLWTWATTGRTVSHVHPANLALAAAIAVMALVGRGFFCGWLCPFGAIQGALHTALTAVVDRVPPARRLRRRIRITSDANGLARRLDRILRYGRWLVLGWALIGAGLTGVMVFREYDPWAALISVAEFEFSLAFVVLLVVLALSLFIKRPFCRYACPLGAIQGLTGKLSPMAIQRDATGCLGCDLCNRACPMSIPVNRRTRVTDTACTGCLECVAACPSRDALGVTIALPLPARRVATAATALTRIPPTTAAVTVPADQS